jgi:lipid A ethanolaminephosphotransferase
MPARIELKQFMTSNRLCALVALWIVATANHSFWSLFHSANGAGAHTWLFAASLAIAVTAFNTLVLRLLSPGRSLRLMLSLMLLLAAITSWFMDTYGVGVDTDMMRNVLQTNPSEARDFVGWSLLWRLLWQAGLPMLLIWRVPLSDVTWLQSLRNYAVGALASVIVLLAVVRPLYVSYASFFRNQRTAEQLMAPGNVIRASIQLALKHQHAAMPFVVVGADAHRAQLTSSHKPMLTLVVVGETARAANFSLGGYQRPTNPQLQARDVLYFSNVHSCGTATAISVPCMFSELPRAEFKVDAADHRDTSLDILQRAGLIVNWVDNQDGCKGVCARVPTEDAVQNETTPCTDHECLDEVLWQALDKKLATLTADTVLVLHAMGSHGPTYHRRVPPKFVVFKPTCATERIETCSNEQIVNAYDNTILYTDHVLAGLIDRLKQRQDHVDSALIYVSDHGESLGENGLYLHGAPYVMAPDLQKHVPMLMWFSANTPDRLSLDLSCLRKQQAQPFTHDNLSHTLLGLNDVATNVYRPQLDLLKTCRSAGAASDTYASMPLRQPPLAHGLAEQHPSRANL